MIFSTLTFFIFFAGVLILLALFKNQNWRKCVLLGSSLIFYGWWDWRFLSLIAFSTLLDYFAGLGIDRHNNPKTKKLILILSLCANLGLLGFFKYFNFFIDSANVAFGFMGFNLSTLNIILPVGISFYTFQTMSYTIDIYRDKIPAHKNFLEFAIFVTFFPQLVAGPIVRASEFLYQFKNQILLRWINFKEGGQIFLFGLVKKILIADRLAFFVDRTFASPDVYNSLTLWLAVITYAIQIYCDFSGYSDMAIGLGKILGFKFPTNFKMPYLSLSVKEFWTRWHISLSTWLKDYLYIPLGGNRKGKSRTVINMFITMLLGGLWHGASWNFVAWGFLHGLGISVNKLFGNFIKLPKNKLTAFLSWLVTFVFILITWVFFRSRDFGVSLAYLKKMFAFSADGVTWLYTPLLLILPIIIIAHLAGKLKNIDVREYLYLNLRTFSGAFVLILVILSLFFLSVTHPNSFIYFQF
ncbi:MAG: MBOAT family O-acyltransferase [Candidatus Komeilibacteria bacterium]|nr:MBOAT family O-acyltransferase [Candidatus Komeilibacteria bacterium]